MKASYKWLKVVLALRVRNFDLAFVILKLVKFSLFNNFFPDLAKFQDLDIFSLFNFLNLDKFPDFLAYSTSFLLISNLSTSSLLSFFSKINLLLLFLLEIDLLLSFWLGANLLDNSVVFRFEMSRITILLKP